MNLLFDTKIADKYTSFSQKIRVLTENWVYRQVYCPNCGNLSIERYENNKPVADFYCTRCDEDYELKSKKDNIGNKVVDGAYKTMIERLTGSNNPNFFLLNYNPTSLTVIDFLIVPKHFFVPEMIEKRKPLAQTARRAGWVGCNILLESIPRTGKIFFVRNRAVEPKEKVLKEWKKTLFLREEKEIYAKGWLLDVMSCVEKLGKKEFALEEVYSFEAVLSKKHPDNRHVKDKIRQQLQILRDKNYVQFIGRGNYKLI